MNVSKKSNSIPKAILEKIKLIQEGQKLNIIIFGPSEFSPDIKLFEKRKQIQELLTKEGHDVTLGEYNQIVIAGINSGLSPYSAEMIACSEADFIINISESAGSLGELCQINVNFPEKSMVCVDIAHMGGYIERSVIRPLEGAHCKIDRFKRPDDIDKCNLAGRIEDHISKVSENKQRLIVDSLFKKI